MKPNKVPPEWKKRCPLITPESYRKILEMLEHPSAPYWRNSAGDKLDRRGLKILNQFSKSVAEYLKSPSKGGYYPDWLFSFLYRHHNQVPLFQKNLPGHFQESNLPTLWKDIPTMGREDLARTPEWVIPLDQPLEEMIVYKTSGSTGHPLLVPHHPYSAASYQPLLEESLKILGIEIPKGGKKVAGFLIGAQKETVTYPTQLSYFHGAGWGKLNLHPDDWREKKDICHFLEEMEPGLLTGDPLSFSFLARIDPKIKPRVLISTAVAMSPKVKSLLEIQFHCPVLEWYSLTETGPIGIFCPEGRGYHLINPSLYLEVLDAMGRICPPGIRGEITLTGGKNPYFPLLRYRTGDWGSLQDKLECQCGIHSPLLTDLEGRIPVTFQDKMGNPVHTLDVSRILRNYPLVQHHFLQKKNGECRLEIRTLIPGDEHFFPNLTIELRELFLGLPIEIKSQPLEFKMAGIHDLDHDSKKMAFQSEIPINEIVNFEE